MAQNSEKTAGNSGRGRGRPFQKGQSGNPGGRPRIAGDVKAMLKAAAPDAARVLIDTINDVQAARSLRIEAAKVLLDRVYGKAAQPIEGVDNRIEIVLAGELEEYAG